MEDLVMEDLTEVELETLNEEDDREAEENEDLKVERRFIFEFYKVYYREKKDNTVTEDNEEIDSNSIDGEYNLLALFAHINDLEFNNRKMKYFDSIARLEKIYYKESTNNKLVASFLKMRDHVQSCKATLNDASTTLGLNDDEYLGDDVSALYDPNLMVLMIQRNINSLRVSAIEEYLNFFVNEIDNRTGCDIEIVLSPIVPKKIQEKIFNAEVVRSFNFRLADFNRDATHIEGPFEEVINFASGFDGTNVEVIVNIGNSRIDALKRSKIKTIVDYILRSKNEGSDSITKSRFKIKANEHTRVEEVDLFSEKLTVEFHHWVSKRGTLNSTEYFSNVMLSKYISVQGLLIDALGDGEGDREE